LWVVPVAVLTSKPRDRVEDTPMSLVTGYENMSAGYPMAITWRATFPEATNIVGVVCCPAALTVLLREAIRSVGVRLWCWLCSR
jgi:hypothetical protein